MGTPAENKAAAEAAVPQEDERTAREVLRQYERLRIVQQRLVRDGHLADDATPDQLIAKLRDMIPHDVL